MGIGIGKHFYCRGVQWVNKDLFGKRILNIASAAFGETSHGPVKFKKAVTPDESRQANYEL
jgi:hypothetical protein